MAKMKIFELWNKHKEGHIQEFKANKIIMHESRKDDWLIDMKNLLLYELKLEAKNYPTNDIRLRVNILQESINLWNRFCREVDDPMITEDSYKYLIAWKFPTLYNHWKISQN